MSPGASDEINSKQKEQFVKIREELGPLKGSSRPMIADSGIRLGPRGFTYVVEIRSICYFEGRDLLLSLSLERVGGEFKLVEIWLKGKPTDEGSGA